MPTTKATCLLFIIPFLLLLGCQEQPEPEVYELTCTVPTEKFVDSISAAGFPKEAEPYKACLKTEKYGATYTMIFEADVLSRKEGIASLSATTECNMTLPSGSIEVPMFVDTGTLKFASLPWDDDVPMLEVDRKNLIGTFKLPLAYLFHAELQTICNLKDISADYAI